MSDKLPSGWARVPLEYVAEINPRHPRALSDNLDSTFVSMSWLSETNCRFEKSEIRKLGDVRKGYTHFAEGDVLFAKITPCMENGKAAVAHDLANGIGCGTTELHVLRPGAAIQSKFLYHFVHQPWFREEAARNFTGTAGQLRVPVSFIRETAIPLPPLLEQKRIVVKLEEVLSKVEANQKRLEKILLLFKRFRQSVLAAACSGRLTADWRKCHSTTEHAAQRWNIKVKTLASVEWPDIPETWVYRTLDQISERVSVTHVGPTAKYYCEPPNGVLFLRSQNVRPWQLDLSGSLHISREFHESNKKSHLKPGDLLIVRVGANRGDTCIIPRGLGEVNCANVIFARPFAGVSEYLNDYFQTPFCQKFLQDLTTGSAQGVINTKVVANVPVALPPLTEQHEIIRRVEELFKLADEIEARYQKGKAHVDKLTQAILAKAFRGELVPQDPNDEPAAMLLERVSTQSGLKHRK